MYTYIYIIIYYTYRYLYCYITLLLSSCDGGIAERRLFGIFVLCAVAAAAPPPPPRGRPDTPPHASAADARRSSRNWPHSRGSNCERGLPTTDRSLNAAERTRSRRTIPIRAQCVRIMPTRDDDKMRLVITRLPYVLYMYTNTHTLFFSSPLFALL